MASLNISRFRLIIRYFDSSENHESAITRDSVSIRYLIKPTEAYYATLIKKGASRESAEEFRIVNLALTRAKRVLWLIVPNDDRAAWTGYLTTPAPANS